MEKNGRKIIETTFLAHAVTNRNNPLVMIGTAKSERDRKQTSPFAKVGFLSGNTLRGWLRHAFEKLLLSHGVSICHNMPEDALTAARNKVYYKEDCTLGYHPRGSCKDQGGCLIHQLFGDRDVTGNLMVPSIMYYPTTTGNGSATTNINKALGGVGMGRVEVVRNSPRARLHTHQTYLTVETLAGIAIEAPLHLVLHQANDAHETLILKGLQYLNEQVKDSTFDFLLGGMRNEGFGRATALPMVAKKSKKKSQKTLANEEEPNGGKSAPKTVIQFKMDKIETNNLNKKFEALVDHEINKRGFKVEKTQEQENDKKSAETVEVSS